jgi:DNA (cytosine-5)-methyltransferase 1
MENVTNSINFLQKSFTFKQLNLSHWAKQHDLNPNTVAINLKENQLIINSADYGSPQIRKRVISGEFVKKCKLIVPFPTHKLLDKGNLQQAYITLAKVKNSLPKVNSSEMDQIITDPLYPQVKIKASEISDHYYDTGLYECEWRQSKFLKLNHPYMGKMSFPENEDKPSRTIMATTIRTSREALIYTSEYERKGNGEYRTPTVRESASIMGFQLHTSS